MRKIPIAIGVAVLLAIIGGWMLITNNGDSQKQTSEANKQILSTQDGRLAKGDENAPVKIVEYADILCPYCAKANEEVLPKIQSDYIDKNLAHYEVRLVATISPDSHRAASGAYCAAEQDKFWSYLDTAYSDTWNNYYSQNKTPSDVPLFTERGIDGFAEKVGLDMIEWRQCMDEGKYDQILEDNRNAMSELDAFGTPHFIINGSNYNGAPPFSAFKAVIDAELNKSKSES